jgi:F-type H+-transporting ATPase subunit b
MTVESKTNKALIGAGGFAVAASTLSVPTVAFAEGSSGGIGAILPNMVEFIPMLVAFIILWVVLAKFGWPAFDKMLQKRADTIQESLEKSEAARVESERVLAEYKQELADAKQQASQIVAEAKKTGEVAKADLSAQAQKEASEMIEKARIAIEAEKKAAIAELQGSVADTSIAIASKLIGNDLNDEEHRAIVERYVNEAGSFNAN